jgi:hypothetical protein
LQTSCTTLYTGFGVSATSAETYPLTVTWITVRFADAYDNWGPSQRYRTAQSQTGGNVGYPSHSYFPYNGFVQLWQWDYAPGVNPYNVTACEVTGAG